MKGNEEELGMKDITAKVVKPIDIEEYQENSIVSRTIVDNSSGTVTLFAVDVEQGVSEHTAPFDALVQLQDREAEITISGKKHVVKQDDMIIMPSNEPHALKAVKIFKMLLTMIKA